MAEDKKMPRHKRMYKDSPKLERGESGKMEAKKPSENQKKADETQSGVPTGESDMEPSSEARMQEIKDMHSRHETEMKAIHARHEKEDAKKYDNPNGDSNEKPDAGKNEVKEVDESKENTE